MFSKKICENCKKKIDKGFLYCPHCGDSSEEGRKKEQKDYGFLGKEDMLKENFKLPFGFNFLLKNLMKEMDKQFREFDRQNGQRENKMGQRKTEKRIVGKDFLTKSGVSINISGGAGKPVIRVKSFGNAPEFKKIEEPEQTIKIVEKRKNPEISEAKARELAKLPKQEAESKVRRLSGKVIYEIELPGVKNIKDIIINELENSIEIKAYAEDKAYFKFLPVALPLLRHRFSKEKLFLELGDK